MRLSHASDIAVGRVCVCVVVATRTFHGYDFGFDHEVGVGYLIFVDTVLRRQGHHPGLFLADNRHELSVARHLRLLLLLRDRRTAAGVAGYALGASRQRGRHAVESAGVLRRRFCNKRQTGPRGAPREKRSRTKPS